MAFAKVIRNFSVVKQLEKDLPELLAFLSFPWDLWRKLRTTTLSPLLLSALPHSIRWCAL
jgi:hypothetical protein